MFAASRAALSSHGAVTPTATSWAGSEPAESDTDEDSYDEDPATPDIERPPRAWQAVTSMADGIPPSPQMNPQSESIFWERTNAPPARRRFLPLSLDFGRGNVFWGLQRTRRRSALSQYGSLERLPSRSPSSMRSSQPGPGSALRPVGYRSRGMDRRGESMETLPIVPSPSCGASHHGWSNAFQPSYQAIDELLGSWWRRSFVLVALPVALVLLWCGVPFPASDRHDPDALRANFWFFLFWYFGCYVAVALTFITQLFTLYRLNWWPKSFGAKWSYALFWGLSLCCGVAIYAYNSRGGWAPRTGVRDDQREWELKTEWVLLTFATMAMPALVCLIGLRRSGRQRYRYPVSDTQRTFAAADAKWHIPASYRRYLWFITTLGISLWTFVAGQGYAILFMSTLPHTSAEGTLYVAFWMATVHVLGAAVQWIMNEKVRSRALLFAFKYYYFIVYFIFYRNLFARLRSFDQFAIVQLLSSTWVCAWYPLCMSRGWLRVLNYFNSRPASYKMHVEKVSLYFYLRNTAQHTTMLAFLGWLSILHFGINQPLYPFFAFDDKDPYTYRLTMLGSLAIWASEILSNFVTVTVRALPSR